MYEFKPFWPRLEVIVYGQWGILRRWSMQILFECILLLFLTTHTNSYFRLTLSLRLLYAPPPLFSDFPSCRFCYIATIAIRSIYLLFVRCPCINEKNSNNFAVKEVGGGCNNSPRPEWDGLAARINKFS